MGETSDYLAKKELMAECRAKKTGNPTLLKDPMLHMPKAEEFCTRQPIMPGAEVFGLQKQKADVPIGVEEEFHRPDKTNFSFRDFTKLQ